MLHFSHPRTRMQSCTNPISSFKHTIADWEAPIWKNGSNDLMSRSVSSGFFKRPGNDETLIIGYWKVVMTVKPFFVIFQFQIIHLIRDPRAILSSIKDQVQVCILSSHHHHQRWKFTSNSSRLRLGYLSCWTQPLFVWTWKTTSKCRTGFLLKGNLNISLLIIIIIWWLNYLWKGTWGCDMKTF